jgi:hypothetical protein
MAWGELCGQAEYWAYRTASCLSIHCLEDPAWLALAFC